MSIEAQGETPEHRARREANTARMESELRELVAKSAVPPSPDLCACGHGRAMHFDEDGDHNGPCLWQVHNDAPFCKCDMWHRNPSEDEFLGVPVSEWRQIAAEINRRRGPDGSLLKRFRELLEVSDMRAALLKKRSAPSPSPALAALVEAGDAMRNAAYRCFSVRHGSQLIPFVAAWDRARAALPKDGAS